MNRFTVLIAAFAIALAGPASAQSFYRYGAAATSVTVAGLVASDGRIIHGKGFSIIHRGTGHYELEFDPGVFPSGCVAVVVEGWEKPLVSEVFEYPTDCRHPEWHVGIRDPGTSQLMDADFQFIAAEEERH